MLGGAFQYGADIAPATRQSPPQHQWFTPKNAILSAAVVAALGFGLGLSAYGGGSDPGWLTEVRTSLQVATGALFFGAGLLHLSAARVTADRSRGQAGVALVVYGFLAPWITGFGHLLHSDETQAVLSPLTTAFIAILALSVGALGLGRMVPDTITAKMHAAGAAGLLTLLLLAPVILHNGLSMSLDLPVAWHLWLETTVATAWFTAAAAAEVHRRRTGVELAGVGLAVLSSMGVVWLFRAAAVADLQPWSVAASLLLASVGLVVLTRAALEFVESAEVGEERMSSAEQALEKVSAAFADLDRQRRDLTHDARNAILALQIASKTLADHGEELNAHMRLRLRLAITEELTHLGQLLAGPSSPAAVVFDVGALIRSITDIEAFNGLRVELDVQPCHVVASPDAVSRVVRNLLVNARQHAAGSPVRIQVREAGSHARIVVEDAGPGIPASLRHSVFGRAVTGVDSDGTGLGLHVSLALMRQQGGSLELDDDFSAAEAGARFLLTLPLAEVSAASDPVPPQRREDRPARCATPQAVSA